MDKRSWQPKKMRNDSTQVFRIDRPSLKDLLFPLIKANGYCHNYIRNNGRNNNGQQKFATEEDEKRFDPLSTVSSKYPLPLLLLLSFHDLSFFISHSQRHRLLACASSSRAILILSIHRTALVGPISLSLPAK